MACFAINVGMLSQPGLLLLRELITCVTIIFIIIRYGNALNITLNIVMWITTGIIYLGCKSGKTSFFPSLSPISFFFISIIVI